MGVVGSVFFFESWDFLFDIWIYRFCGSGNFSKYGCGLCLNYVWMG